VGPKSCWGGGNRKDGKQKKGFAKWYEPWVNGGTGGGGAGKEPNDAKKKQRGEGGEGKTVKV